MTEWVAYERINGPLGYARDDFHWARLLHALANMMRGKDDEPIPFQEFFVDWEKAQSGEEQEDELPPVHHSVTTFEAMFAAYQDNQ